MRLRWRSIASAVLCLLGVLGGWVATPAESYPLSAARDDLIDVIDGGWHTEIAVPRGAIDGRLATLAAEFPGARYLVFGWGARDFYMAQNPGLADLLRAAVPGPAVMLVIPLAVPPAAYFGAAQVWPITVSRDGTVWLSQFLWESVAKDRSGAPIRAGAGPDPQSIFYAATGTYDASDTCNTWTAQALRAAGLPVTAAGVVFAGQLLDQLPPLSAASSGGNAR
jgi:uncharacterized protein (TIGR02117 family)